VDPQLGSPSGYYEFDIRQNLEHILKYAFNPAAGWSKINAVKNHHIHNGMIRFAKSFKEILEYPSLPGINAFSDALVILPKLIDEIERIKVRLN
jgi:hypothetical protein